MKYHQEIRCPDCGHTDLLKAGKSLKGVQRYRCINEACQRKTFMLEYAYKAYEPGVKKQLIEMAINGSGIRDTARVLSIGVSTVLRTLKKS